jgi:hypothetical protein
MGLDLWFREDVSRILAATHETMQVSFRATPPASPELADTYRQGFADALQSVAIAFGLAGPTELGARPQEGPDHWREGRRTAAESGGGRWPSSHGRGQ